MNAYKVTLVRGRKPMKQRRKKHRENRHIHKALLSTNRELGDHRRWWWMATMPIEIISPVLGQCTLFFDPKLGRLYRPRQGHFG
jgi:hypothetical protein